MNSLNLHEIYMLDFIQEHFKCGFLDIVLPHITRLADGGFIWILLAVVLLFFKKTRKAGCIMGLALIIGVIFGNLLLKPLVARIRPYDVNQEADLLIDRLKDYSFPSGHTLASFEGSVALMLTHRKSLGIPAFIFAFIIAFSRLYLYVHYPTDVLAGAVLGTFFACVSFCIVNYICKKYGKCYSLNRR